MRLYTDLAAWYHLITHPDDYAAEAAHIVALARHFADGDAQTLLELGCGGGCNAFHYKHHFAAVLSDLSPEMLALSRSINPECEHVVGDMRTLRLGRQFDVVLVHDALAYLLDEKDLHAAMATVVAHLRPGGVAVLIPDHVAETFAAATDCGGRDGEGGHAARYLEWVWDPDPRDHQFVVDYVFQLREANGSVRVEADRHVEAAWPRATWERAIAGAGLELVDASVVDDPHEGEHVVFAARRP